MKRTLCRSFFVQASILDQCDIILLSVHTNSKESEAMHMKQKTMETKRFWISISIGLAIVVVLLAANLWQMNRENSVTGAKQVWSECIEH